MLWYAAIASSSWEALKCSLHGAGWRRLLMVCTLTYYLHVVHGHMVHGHMVHDHMVHGHVVHANDAAWLNAAWLLAAQPNSAAIQQGEILLS